ncbi:hypothetical protein Pint_11799 [Pistacia integerrima]|uniref:Uncharacterized protein n=1 Tax=Pistacia integerrima TaxID=434235 RepID=A0ACC0XHL3_9ROSI|nr:hypothetical protein Pint_11799 [Pistacia integerrima]
MRLCLDFKKEGLLSFKTTPIDPSRGFLLGQVKNAANGVTLNAATEPVASATEPVTSPNSTS